MNNFRLNHNKTFFEVVFPFFFGFIFIIAAIMIGIQLYAIIVYGPQVAEKGIDILDKIPDLIDKMGEKK